MTSRDWPEKRAGTSKVCSRGDRRPTWVAVIRTVASAGGGAASGLPQCWQKLPSSGLWPGLWGQSITDSPFAPQPPAHRPLPAVLDQAFGGEGGLVQSPLVRDLQAVAE